MRGQDIKSALGRNIKHFRFHQQLSQADLAEKADISITFLSNIERGNKFPLADTLASIANGLEIEVHELFRPETVPAESKKLIDRFTSDIKNHVIQALDEVFGQYRG